MIYEIERIRNKTTGEPHERESRRKGHRVKLEILKLGKPMFLRYIDEEDAILQTSRVEAYNAEYKTASFLTVQTRNTVYMFRKVSEH
jgi:hypothetical protein